MLPAQLHALLLAALLAAPLLLLLRRHFDVRLPWFQLNGPDLVSRLARWYPWSVAVWAVWLAVGVYQQSLSLQHNIETATLVLIVLGCVTVAPSFPVAGPIAYVLLSYTFGRDDTVTVTLMDLGATSAVAALSAAASLVWLSRQSHVLRLPDGLLVWCVAAFAAALSISVVAAVLAGRPVHPDLTARAARYIQAVALFLVAATCRPGLREIRLMVLALSTALVIRQVFLTSYWLLEQNLAMLTVVTVPVALAIASCRPFSRLQMPLAALALYMAAMILFVRNRGAVVGLAAACAGLWPLARRPWVGLLLLATVPLGAGYLAYEAGLLDRFRQVYEQGRFLGTAAERLEIWSHASRIARDHWLSGVGPGNFEFALSAYTSGRFTLSAHNSFVELMVEAGLLALLGYLAVFGATCVQLVRVARRFPSSWKRTMAAGLLGSLAAHLAAGAFLSNPSLVWTWILIGVAASLTDSAAPERRGSVPAKEHAHQ